MSLDSPPKAGHLTLSVQNGDSKVNGVNILNSIGKGGFGKSPTKPGFFVSFLVDARGGKMHGKRHSGVDLIIPPSKVCMPTRITCRLIRKEKLANPPVLKEGEALASRIAELGPVGEKFLGAVLIELPHFASRVDAERELVVLRSDNAVTWHEHQTQTPSDSLNKLISSADEDEADEVTEKRVVRIFTVDFPRYFVAVTRVRQDSKTIGASGGSVKSSASQAVATFPDGAISKDIKVGLQVLPVAPEAVVRLMGQSVPMSAVTTIEPRRRKFHAPVTLTIPVPKGMQESIKKQKKDENPAVHILYSITGGNNPSQWEDITGSAPLNSTNDSVSFSTIVSARYWLMDCRNVAMPVKAAGELFQDAVKAPFLAKFFVLAKRHSTSEAQVRVLCLTDDDISATLERQEQFDIIGTTKDVEVFEGKPYYVDVAGNFAPVASSGQELFITFHSFRVNRLSFVARVVDSSRPPAAQFFVNKELAVSGGKVMEPPLFSLNVTLPDFDAGLISPDMEPEQWKAKFESAKLSVAQERPPVSAALKLTDIAEALQGDWVPLAAQLGISQREVVKIQTEYGSAPEQAILMLHLWVEKLGIRATGNELERALKKIGRDDVIDRCIYNRTNEISAVTDDQGLLNPIDSSFRSQDHGPGYEAVQVSRTESQPEVEVEEGVVYQLEEVWDGTRWHKTRIAVQKPEESTTQTAVNDLPTSGLQQVEEKFETAPSHEVDLSFGVEPEKLESAPSHELGFSVGVEPEKFESAPSHELGFSVGVEPEKFESAPSHELGFSVGVEPEKFESAPSHELGFSAGVEPEKFESAPSHELGLSFGVEPENHAAMHHETGDQSTEPQTIECPSHVAAEPKYQGAMELEIENQSNDALTGDSDLLAASGDDTGFVPSVEVALSSKPYEMADNEVHLPAFKREDNDVEIALATKPDETAENQSDFAFKHEDSVVPTIEIALASDLDESVEDQYDLPADKNEDAFSQPTEENVVEKKSGPADEPVVKITTDTTVGDPKVTTEVEEFEETLDDGTVVKRKVIKTKEEQMVTQRFMMEGPDGAFDSADKMITDSVTDADGASSPGTVVEETEETREDGTVVKRKTVKTTIQHVETETL